MLDSEASLVELDLLRGGDRLPMDDPLPPADYYAIVSRDGQPAAEVYAWTLRQPLPKVPIPLADDDPDVQIELQEVFTSLYDHAGYDYTLDYRAPVVPPLSDADADWVKSTLAAFEHD